MNDQNFLKIPQSSEKYLDSNANDESNINVVTNNKISKISTESYNDVDNSLMRITKQVRKNIEVAKAEFDTFLCRENPMQNDTTDITSPKITPDLRSEMITNTSSDKIVLEKIFKNNIDDVGPIISDKERPDV